MFDHSPDTPVDHFDEIVATTRQQLLNVVPEQVAHLHWDAESLAQYRSARLTDALHFAAERSPWHAGRLSGLDLEAVTPDDLTSLPTMTKAGLMDAWDRIVTDPRLSLDSARQHLARIDDGGLPVLLDNYFVFTTGGTSGRPGVFVWSTEEFARWSASTIRLGLDAGDPPATRLTFVAARSLRHPSAWAPLLFHGRHAGSRQSVPIDQPVSAIVEQLNVIDPDSLWVVSSVLPALVDAAAAGTLRISPRRIVAGADAVDPRALDAAEAVFGTRPVESYATTDVGMVADQAPTDDTLIVHDDLMIVEPVDEDDGPVPAGELSHHVLVTSLHQRTMPMIRYRIDDRICVAPRAGGRYPAFMRVASIDGRADDFFRYGDVTVHPHTFRSVLTRHASVEDYQVRQEPDGAEVLIKVGGSCDVATLTAELTGALVVAGIPGATTRVTVVDGIPRTRLGKRLHFQPMRLPG
jgi:phenylacetate-coenzyme A ligase PaaK-like adenylate-forming protein